MAKRNTNAGEATKGNTSTGSADADEKVGQAINSAFAEQFKANAMNALPEGAVNLGLDRLFYKPGKCQGAELRGILWDIIKLEGDTGLFDAFVFKVTRPTKGCLQDQENPEADDDGDVIVDVDAGEEVLISVTEKLKALKPYAINSEMCVEFVIRPLGEYRIGGTDEKPKTMHRYKVAGFAPIRRDQVVNQAFAALGAAGSNGKRAELPSAGA